MLIQNAKCDLNCRMNSLLADFSYCNSDTISMLFKSYCMNIYGSQIWKFYNKAAKKIYTAWRKAIRQIYKLPYRTHNILINHKYNIIFVYYQFYLLCTNKDYYYYK